MDGDRYRMGDNPHPFGGGQILFKGAGVHPVTATAVDQRHVQRAQKLGLHCGVHRRHATPDHHHITANRHAAHVIGLSQISDEINGIGDTVFVLTFSAQCIDPTKADAKEHRVIFVSQPVQRHTLPHSNLVLKRDAANLHQPIHLTLSELIWGFVRCNAVFIQAARFGSRIIDHNVMPQHRQPVRTSQPRRTGPQYGHCFASDRSPGERMNPFALQCVCCVALQLPDQHWFAFGQFAHACLFAQCLCGADTRAHAAQDVLTQDCFSRRIGRACGDLANEKGNVDICGTGCDTRRIMAKIAPVRRHQRLVIGQGRM